MKNGKIQYVKPKKRYWNQWSRLGFEGFCLIDIETSKKMVQLALTESPSPAKIFLPQKERGENQNSSTAYHVKEYDT